MMIMMGYNEPADDEDHLKINTNMLESFTNRRPKFKPPTPPPPPTCTAVSSSTAFFSAHHHHHHHHLSTDENYKIEEVVQSSRWNPTPEQVQTLEELYRQGTRTPSADEIQHITTQLRRYGKIQGKNVFYWFQNHKARERQKRRRRQLLHLHDPPTPSPTFINNNNNHHHSLQHHQHSEVEETRNWGIPTSSDSEKNVVKERKGQVESRMTKTNEVGMISIEQQGNDHELLFLHQRRKNIIWNHMMQCLPSSSPSSSSSSNNNHHITIDPATLITTTTAASASNTLPTLMVSSQSHQQHPHEVDYSCETLELFPVNRYGHGKEQPEKCFVPMGDVGLCSRRFIDFLPLKN